MRMSVFSEMHVEVYKGGMIRGIYFNVLHKKEKKSIK